MALPPGVERRNDDGVLATGNIDEPSSDWSRWDPGRSKVAAMLEIGMETGLEAGQSILYLGAATGTTVDHLADFSGPIYAVEFAHKPMRHLIERVGDRTNVYPLFKDARRPETYAHVVEANIDVVIQDVATRGQATVAAVNRRFLSPEGRLLLVLKSRSEDVTKSPNTVFETVLSELEESYTILETNRLDPYHMDHLAVIARPRR